MAQKWAVKNKDRSYNLAKSKATEEQWGLVDMAIKAFITRYPKQWFSFQRELKAEATEYQLATKEHKELRKRNWRKTASFPVVEYVDSQGLLQQDSLLQVIEKFIPRLTHKNSVNYGEFLRRYPMFLPSEKTNWSNF